MASRYELMTTEHHNPVVAWSHRSRLGRGVRLASQYLPQNGSLLDVGAGNGAFLRMIAAGRGDASFGGVEPFAKVSAPFEHFDHIGEVQKSYDVITAFETLEHLEPAHFKAFFALVKKNLRPSGVCIISVPILVGPVLLAKNLNAKRTGAGWTYSTAEALKGAFKLEVPKERGQGRGQLNHRGFDFRTVRARIRSEFRIVREFNGPVPLLWWGLNSQWYCVFGNRS